MPNFTPGDWYSKPHYYDIVFDADTGREADFLEAALARHGPARLRRGGRARLLEPACGTARLLIELARRGHRAVGFDASAGMLGYARRRLLDEPAGVRRATTLRRARMESFRLPGPFDLAFCLLSTFKYLLTEEAAAAHLRRVARRLARGGLYVLGLHLTDYARRRTDREVWRGAQDGIDVTSEVITRPADRRTRLEWLRNRMIVRRRGQRRVERFETNWQCRTYDAAEVGQLLACAPKLELVACHDFGHDIDAPRALDDSQEDIVLVLRKK